MKTFNTLSMVVQILVMNVFIATPSFCLGDDAVHSIGCIQSLKLLCQAMADTNRPHSISVSANRTITIPERPADEVRKQLEDNYNEMISVQGSNMVASMFPTLDDFVAWYYRENKEASLSVRKLKDKALICGDAEVFEQIPLNENSDVDEHVIYMNDIPSGPDGAKAFVEINHSRERCYRFNANQWKLPPYSTFGTFTDRDRFLMHILLRSLDINDDIAIAKLCDNNGDGMCQVAITESIREMRPVLEFIFTVVGDSGTTNKTVSISKWVVDKSDMRVVYESAQYANGQLLDSSIAEGFRWDAAFKYPQKVTMCENKNGHGHKTIVYEILGVSTNDLSSEMTLDDLLRRFMGESVYPIIESQKGEGGMSVES